MREPPPERVALLLLLATFLFAGALRAFLSGVYYQNLASLGLNASALFSLLLLAPLLFLVPALRRRPRALLLASALALVLARALLPATRGTPLHLPVAGLGAAAWLTLIGSLLPLMRGPLAATAGAGVALGWALDVAFLWMGDSADPTAGARGLVLVVPSGLLLLLTAVDASRRLDAAAAPARAAWGAGAAFGAWLFLVFTLAANPYGAARWNEAAPFATAAASVAGLVAGAFLALRPLAPRALLALHAAAALALVDHALLHTPLFPLLLAILAATLALDGALLLRAMGAGRDGRALALAGLVALLLHFVYAFTFLFEYVPLGALWEGRAPLLYVAAGALAFAPLLRRALSWAGDRGRARPLLALAFAPLLVAAFAAASPPATVLGPPDDGSMRVLAFNVHQGFANDGALDPDAFVAVLQEARADVVLLQEADTPRFTSGNLDMAGYLAARMGYHLAYGQPTSAQAFGGALLSRWPIVEWTAHELPSASDDRYFLEARLDVGGREVWVYAVHLALPLEDRLAQTDALLAQAATRGGTRILAGDFNSCPSGLCPDEPAADDVYARVTAQYRDAWAAIGRDADDPAAYTYDASAPSHRIDYVFVSREVQVVAAGTVASEAARRASDHLPVGAELRLP